MIIAEFSRLNNQTWALKVETKGLNNGFKSVLSKFCCKCGVNGVKWSY